MSNLFFNTSSTEKMIAQPQMEGPLNFFGLHVGRQSQLFCISKQMTACPCKVFARKILFFCELKTFTMTKEKSAIFFNNAARATSFCFDVTVKVTQSI